MIDSMLARARFYDITGYWIPGNLAIALAWFYVWAFGYQEQANKIIQYAAERWIVLMVFVCVACGYAIGHMVNAISKLVLEKCILVRQFKKDSDWLQRVKDDQSGRGIEILRRFEKEFHYKPVSSDADGGVIQGWAEQKMTAPSMTTFRYLCFYGINRTLLLLSLASIPPIAYVVYSKTCWCCMIMSVIVGILISIIFGYQYLRFVKYYADSLPELLLMMGDTNFVEGGDGDE